MKRTVTRKWLTLKSGKEVIGYVKVGLKVSDISIALRAATDEIKQIAKTAPKPVATKVTPKSVVKRVATSKSVVKKVTPKSVVKKVATPKAAQTAAVSQSEVK